MENGGGFPMPSSSPCFPFPDQLVVPATGTTASSASGPRHSHQYHRHHHLQQQQQGHHHLTCLKLGKRQYCARDDPSSTSATDHSANITASGVAIKRERSSPPCAVVPRCQVEGCNKALIDAKDYHRRHKVCQMHSKAPIVVVLGTEQRFCQQCSRFHAISEFDDSKRSCRRRLAGHNERRRKSSSSSTDSLVRNPVAASVVETTSMGSRFPYLSQTSPGRALSLLSSKASSWIPAAEVSSRSSAALRELIAENRAALLAGQLFSNHGYGNQSILSFGPHRDQESAHDTAQLVNGWNQFQESGRGTTLDLMQNPNSTSLEFLPGRKKSKEEEEEECCEIWKSLEGTHVA